MAITIDLQPEVRDWIALNLRQGVPGQAVRDELVRHKVLPEVAGAMVEAVTRFVAQGEDADSARAAYLPAPLRMAEGARIRVGERDVRVLMRVQRPAAALLSGLLDEQECEDLIALARPRLQRSTVVDPVTGLDIVAGHRSSDGMFFRLGEHPLVAAIEQRISILTGTPVENGEGLQLLHYPVGAQTTPHRDYLQPTNEANRESIARSGQRTSTLIMYLNDVASGGETSFPATGLSVLPQRGQALYFEYFNAAGDCDPASLHAGDPVLVGEKWIATKWLRSRRFVSRAPALA